MDKSAAKVPGTASATGAMARRRPGAMVTALVLSSLGCASLAQKRVTRELSGARGRISVAVRQLGSDGGWDVGGDEPFAAGDTVAVFVLADLFRQVEAGEVSLDEKLKVEKELADGRSGTKTRPGLLASLRSVSEVSLHDLLVLALAYGDPTAINLLMARLGSENINDTAQTLGAEGTRIERKLGHLAPPENYTTANDLVAVWSSLLHGDAYSAGTRESIHRILRASREPLRHLGKDLAASDVRMSLDGDSPGRAATVHASGVMHLPGRKLALAVMGERFESRRYGQDVVFRVAKIVHVCNEEEVRRAAR